MPPPPLTSFLAFKSSSLAGFFALFDFVFMEGSFGWAYISAYAQCSALANLITHSDCDSQSARFARAFGSSDLTMNERSFIVLPGVFHERE
jgi:hypothetical protein